MAEIKSSYPRTLMLTHDLIGGKWKLRILWHIIHGNNRYSMILRGIPEISQKVLGSQLKELEKSGILIKTIIDNNPPKVIEYAIADQYRDLHSVVDVLSDFTKKYAKNNNIEVNASES